MSSGLSLVTGFVLTAASFSEKAFFVTPCSLKILRMAGVWSAKIPSIRCSTEMYSSPMLLAAFSAAPRMRFVSLARYISPPRTFGRVEI